MQKNRPVQLQNNIEFWGASTLIRPNIPVDNFKEFNRVVGNPKLPATGEANDIFDYQEAYEKEWNTHHKLILNKSRKIGATETALRIIAYNCMNGTYLPHHRIMILAGTKQDMSNRFLARFKAIFDKGFTDKSDVFWSTAKKAGEGKDERPIFSEQKSSHKLTMYNGINIQAYPANEAVRGEENIVCVFISEAAFSNLIDDSKVYNAVHPNVANIENADFIMESTPNGKRGYYWELGDKGPHGKSKDYRYIEQPYNVSMGKLLDEEFIEKERVNPKIDFQQEYCCKFTTSLSSVFREEDVNYVPKTIDTYDDL